jgi:glycosyltransferase domain-containing protein
MGHTLKSHTLVIPTFNRSELLNRAIEYYGRSAQHMPILVLDSSSAEVAGRNGKQLSAKHANLRHKTFETSIPMAQKICHGLEFVDTPTVSLCADDDLVLPTMLETASEFLAKSPEYVCAHGLYLNFTVNGSAVTLTKEYCGPSIEDTNGAERVFSLMQNYESLFYAVYRTSHLKNIFDGVSRQKTLHYQELFQSVASLFIGKTKRFPSIYAARQSCDPAEPERDKWQTYYWFADNADDFIAQYGRYREDLCDFVTANRCCPHLTREECKMVLDLSHATYFSAGCPPMYFRDRLNDTIPDAAFRVRRSHDTFKDLGGRFSQVISRLADSLVAFPARVRNLFGRVLGKLSARAISVPASDAREPLGGNVYFHIAPELRPLFKSMQLRRFVSEMTFYLHSSPPK